MAKIEGTFIVVDEVCSCGHLRSKHKPHGIDPNLDGHGPCEEYTCTELECCKKFTWVAWVVK